MARLISVPGVASLLLVTSAREIDDLIDHPLLERRFARQGRLVNRLLVSGLGRFMTHRGETLPAFRPQRDAARVEQQRALFERLDGYVAGANWPSAPVSQMARYVADGHDRRSAEAALAYAIAWPFLAQAPAASADDAYKPVGRHLWRLHRRTARARSTLSPAGLVLRLVGGDRRARAAILELTSGDHYGLHAVEITLDNARTILGTMRRIVAAHPQPEKLAAADLAWAAIRTAPEVVVRQSGEASATLPHVAGRVPPHTLVLLRMRRSLGVEQPAGYEFASAHWPACPARRYVMGLFAAVAAAAVEKQRAGDRA